MLCRLCKLIASSWVHLDNRKCKVCFRCWQRNLMSLGRRSHMLWNGKDLWIPRHDDLLQISIGWDCRDWCSLHQEPAILALKHAVRESMSTVEFVMEESLVEEHQSNGTIEVTVREIQKTNQSDEECVGKERMKCEVPFDASHPGVLRGARGNVDAKVSSWP